MKHINKFKTLQEYEDAVIPKAPSVNYIIEGKEVKYLEQAVVPNKYIAYTTNDHQALNITNYYFGSNRVQDSYTDGQGLMLFEGPVTTIGFGSFQGCSSLTSIVIPNSVTNIENYAFSGCSTLTSITIPNSVTNIGSQAFSGCYILTSITIPNSVTNIGDNAFYGCTSLTSITIPNSVTRIGNYAFGSCSRLTSITIGSGVTSIGLYAFRTCSSLTSVTIPESVTSIGEGAFGACSKLTSITCKATTPPKLDSNNYLSNVTAVYVPADSVDLYRNATNWAQYANKIQPIN